MIIKDSSLRAKRSNPVLILPNLLMASAIFFLDCHVSPLGFLAMTNFFSFKFHTEIKHSLGFLVVPHLSLPQRGRNLREIATATKGGFAMTKTFIINGLCEKYPLLGLLMKKSYFSVFGVSLMMEYPLLHDILRQYGGQSSYLSFGVFQQYHRPIKLP